MADSLESRLSALLPKPSPAQVAELKARHPGVALVLITTAGELCAVVGERVAPEVWARFRKNHAGRARSRALGMLFREVVLFPSLADVDAALALRPGLADTFGAYVCGLAGLESKPPPTPKGSARVVNPAKEHLRCPGCGARLIPAGNGSFECYSKKHMKEREVRVYWPGKNGRLRPGSEYAAPDSKARRELESET